MTSHQQRNARPSLASPPPGILPSEFSKHSATLLDLAKEKVRETSAIYGLERGHGYGSSLSSSTLALHGRTTDPSTRSLAPSDSLQIMSPDQRSTIEQSPQPNAQDSYLVMEDEEERFLRIHQEAAVKDRETQETNEYVDNQVTTSTLVPSSGNSASELDEGQTEKTLGIREEQSAAGGRLLNFTPPRKRSSSFESLLQMEKQEQVEVELFENRGSISYRGGDGTSSSSSLAKQKGGGGRKDQIEVPLLPVSLLKQKHRKDLTPSPVEEVHLDAQFNLLMQVTEPVPWRCLKCFTVFEAIPKQILVTPREQKINQAQMERLWPRLKDKRFKEEKEAVEREYKARRVTARGPSAPKVRPNQPLSEICSCCPNCKAKGKENVQWLANYAHYTTHTPKS